MFDELSTKLDGVLRRFRQRGVLTEPMIRDGLREVRRVLLEADVNFRVTKDFLARVQERALGEQVLKAVSPGQQVVKIVHEELANLLGEEPPTLEGCTLREARRRALEHGYRLRPEGSGVVLRQFPPEAGSIRVILGERNRG